MIELLSPAGEIDSLEKAFMYGADAVYLGTKQFSMRMNTKNFELSTLKKYVEYAHSLNKKIYVTVNTLPSNEEVSGIEKYIDELNEIRVDAIIAADIGILMLSKSIAPSLDVHISTQAGVTNYLTANKLFELGATRIVLARELDIKDIKTIRKKCDKNLELEAFVHGSMCMSFSGRCFLSNYLTGRDANRGNCTQPCRWNYKAYVEEEKRPGMLIPVRQNENGSTIFNAQDLNMIDHLDDLINAGISSLKIEGRAKSSYYTAVVTNSYRVALDQVKAKGKVPKWCVDELENVSHRAYSTGFYYSGKMSSNKRVAPLQTYKKNYIRNIKVMADVVEIVSKNMLKIKIKNRIEKNQKYEVIIPFKKPKSIKIINIFELNKKIIDCANKTMNEYYIEVSDTKNISKYSILRMKIDD